MSNTEEEMESENINCSENCVLFRMHSTPNTHDRRKRMSCNKSHIMRFLNFE